MSEQLTTNFTYEEFIASTTAVRLGIDNTPPPEIEENIRNILAPNAQTIRNFLGFPVLVDSGYRCEALNTAVKGVPNSAHTQGYAMDFVCPSFGTPKQIVEAIVKGNIKYDQCIEEGTWVHISFDPRLRQQTLTAEFNGKGVATYRAGVS